MVLSLHFHRRMSGHYRDSYHLEKGGNRLHMVEMALCRFRVLPPPPEERDTRDTPPLRTDALLAVCVVVVVAGS